VPETKQRAAFLNRIHLFSGLRDEELEGIARHMEEKHILADTVIFKRGDNPDGFYLIYKGKVMVTRPYEGERREDFLAWLVGNDYFGEEALVENRKRSATIKTVEDSILLFLSRERFDELRKKYARLEPNLDVAIKSRKLARATRFKWLGKNEVIYFVARRHLIRLYQVLLFPLFALALPAILFSWAYVSQATTPVVLGTILLVVILLWAIWLVLDWSNDYYIVTNQRVIWVERVIGIYDSRQEAPLGTILSVGVETDVIGRALDYGHISVRTFVGNIRFEYVDHPNQAAELIRELWERTKSKGTQAQKDAMKNAIRAKLGMTVHKKEEEEELTPAAPPVDKEVQKKGLLRLALGNMFKMRMEEGGTVIYHKHWIVLLKQMGRPLIFFLILLGLMLSRIWNLAWDSERAVVEILETGGFRPDTLVVAIPALMLPFIGWMIWEYVDWANDTFMVTPEEIVDIDRTPLGTEERRAAQIENILSTEYKRVGLLGYLFNYGTVFIVVGGTKLSFQDVLDPAGVQADINRRRMARIAKKNEETASVERERMAAWLVSYHQNRDEFHQAPVDVDEDEIARLGKAAGQDLVDSGEGLMDDAMGDDQSMEGMEG
jgi:CRP-like cAMP-binding protein